jgi:hypothetical protein
MLEKNNDRNLGIISETMEPIICGFITGTRAVNVTDI